MRCNAYKCWNNDGDGYCMCDSYITIDINGECDSYYVPIQTNQEEKKDETLR